MSSYTDAVLADAPWGFWQETETSGTTLADSSGNGHDLTITPATSAPTLGVAGPVAGVSAVSWQTSTTTSKSYAKTAGNIPTSTTTGTQEAWVYLTALPTSPTPLVTIASAESASGGNLNLYIDTSGRPVLWINNGSNIFATGTALALNTWHHVIGSIGAAGMKVRADKATTGTNTPTSYLVSTFPIFVRGGIYGPGAGIHLDLGSPVTIASPAYYPTQLSDAQTDAHYNAMFVAAPVALSASASARSAGSAAVTQAIAGTAAASGGAGAQASGSLASTAAGSGVGVSSGHAIASVGVDIVPASGAGIGVSSGAADVQRAVTATADALATSSAAAEATSFAQPTGTDKTNRGNGIRLSGSATVDVQPPLEDDPPNLTTVPIHIITPTVPAPTLVNGRPQ